VSGVRRRRAIGSPRAIARAARLVAVVGLSRDPKKVAHANLAYLQSVGYRIPVNPAISDGLGETSRRSLRAITEHIAIVQVFRPGSDAPAIAADAVAIGAESLWLQQGIPSPEAREIADPGLDSIEDTWLATTVAHMVSDGTVDER
jgi:uncharacterized protein